MTWDAQLHHVEIVYNNSEPQLARPPTRFASASNRTFLSLYFRSLWSRRPSGSGPPSPCILRPSVGSQTARGTLLFAKCSLDSCSCGTVQLSPLGFCIRSPTSLWIIGLGGITRPPLFAKAQRPARMRRCSRPNFPSIGRALTGSVQSTPVPLATHRTVPSSEINSSIGNSPRSCPAQMRTTRISVERCKPCTNPHDRDDMPKYLPDGLTRYVLNNFTKKCPPYHVTQDDVSAPLQRLEVERTTGRAINPSAVEAGSSR